MAIDYTGVTKIIKLDTNNNPETQTEIKRVYLGEALQWQKSQSQYVWQCVHTGMAQPWTVGDLVCLVKFTRTNTSQKVYYDKTQTYSTPRVGIIHAYPNVQQIAGTRDTTANGDITLYYDSVLGWCLTDNILPNQVNIVVKTSGKYAQIQNNYSYLGSPNLNSTGSNYAHYLAYHPNYYRVWWYPNTFYETSPNNTYFTTVWLRYGTTTAPDTTSTVWHLYKSGTLSNKSAWIPEAGEVNSSDEHAQWAFFKRVRNANNQ